MKNKASNSGKDLPFSVGARCINGDWFGMSLPAVWLIMEDYLFLIQKLYELEIHSFVLMSNHFHALIGAPKGNISQAFQQFLTNTSKEISRPAGRINQTWKAKFFRCEVRTAHYYHHAYKYIYRNPVAAGICTKVEEYRFSTLHGLLGFSKLIIPMVYDPILMEDPEGTLNWLNTPACDERAVAVQKALRRRIFRLPRHKGRANPLETCTY